MIVIMIITLQVQSTQTICPQGTTVGCQESPFLDDDDDDGEVTMMMMVMMMMVMALCVFHPVQNMSQVITGGSQSQYQAGSQRRVSVVRNHFL